MKKRTVFIGGILFLFSFIPLKSFENFKTGFLSINFLSLPFEQKKVLANSHTYYGSLEQRRALALFNKALKKSNIGNFKGAIEDYSKYIRKYPKDGNVVNAYYNRGWSKKRIGDYFGAIEDYRKSLNIIPSGDAYFNIGEIYQNELNDNYAAILAYNEAIKLTNKVSDYFYNRSIAKFETNDLKGSCLDAIMAKNLGAQKYSKGLNDWIKNNCKGFK